MEPKRAVLVFAIAVITIALVLLVLQRVLLPQYEVKAANCTSNPSQSVIILPAPDYTGSSVEEAIAQRRSVRGYNDEPISQAELSLILWAGQGITENGTGKRTAPSAGGLYPIELYVVPNRVAGINCGVYHYVPQGHKLVLFREGNFSDGVYRAALSQSAVKDAGAVIVFTAVRERTASKYGDPADRYIAMEAGHISQNILLESVSLGLGAVPIGGFDRQRLDELLGMNGTDESSIYINAIGKAE